jgi:hypothetical protein
MTSPPAGGGDGHRFDFAFDDRLRPVARLFGVRPGNAYVRVGGGDLAIRFGPWSLRTALANVAGATPTGPYRWWRVAGPARLSLADRGITFATSTSGGLCISFHEPVAALVPAPVVRHPAATVTVADPEGLARLLTG